MQYKASRKMTKINQLNSTSVINKINYFITSYLNKFSMSLKMLHSLFNYKNPNNMLEIKYLKPFEKKDAAAVSHLFKIVYGDNYVYPEVYDPEAFCKNHEDGTWQSIIAIGTNDEIIGHELLWRHPDCPQIPEMCLMLVHPDARNLRLGSKMSQALISIAKENGSIGVSGKQVCSHPFTQRILRSLNFLSPNFWPDYISSPFYSNQTRESILGAYLPFRKDPTKELFLPEVLISNAKIWISGLNEVKALTHPKKYDVPPDSKIEKLPSENQMLELYIRNWGLDGFNKLKIINQDKLTFILVNAELSENALACEYLLSLNYSFMGVVPTRFTTWSWLFCKNFSLETSFYILDDKVKNLLENESKIYNSLSSVVSI